MQLEQELGAPLFCRTHQSVRLTEYGRLTIPHARRILAECDSVKEDLRHEKNRLSGSLAVACYFDAFGNTAGRSFDTFRSQFPKAEISFASIDAITTTEAYLHTHPETDLIINYLCEPLPSDIYETQVLFYEQLHLIVPKKHPLASKARITPQDIEALPFIRCDETQQPFYRNLIETWMAKENITCKNGRSARSMKQALVMIESGLGCTIAPWTDDRYRIMEIAGVPLADISCRIPVAAIWRTENLNPHILPLVRILQDGLAG